MKFKTLTLPVLCLMIAGVMLTDQAFAQGRGTKPSASGHGTLLVTDGFGIFRRQFSFEAMNTGDGTAAKGNAILHNPAFTGIDSKRYYLQLDVVCMKVENNHAIIAGFPKRTNDENLNLGAAFYVEDNGEPGKDIDKITRVNFFDPNGPLDPYDCGSVEMLNFVLNNSAPEPIEAGNIQVKGGSVSITGQ